MPVPFKTPCRLTVLKCEKGEARPVWEANNENEYMALLKEKQGSLFEMVGDGMPVKAYLDCDFKLSYDEYHSLVGQDGIERYFINSNVTDKYGITAIRKIINDIPMFKDKPRFEMIREARMDKDKCKFSYRHVIDITFKSNNHIKRYLESLNFKHNEPFDLSVYNDGRIMNSVHSTKDFLCSLPLKPAEFQKTLPVENFLITCVNPDHPVVAIEEPTKIKPIKSIIDKIEDIDIDSIKGLLSCIPSNIGYQDWFKCMTVVKTITNDSQEGYDIADDWSATDSSYDARGFARTWKSAKMGTVNMGTLIHYAKEHNLERFNIEWLPNFGTKMLNPYEKMKMKFEMEVCKIKAPACFVQKKNQHEDIIVKKQGILDSYQNWTYKEVKKTAKGEKTEEKSFTAKWLTDSTMRQYDEIVFDPSESCDANKYNTYKPMIAELIEGERLSIEEIKEIIKPMLDHCSMLLRDANDFFIIWCAWIIQKRTRTDVAILLHSEKEGAGKSLIIQLLGLAIIGEHLFTTTSDPENDIFGKHGTGMVNKLLVNVEETNGKDMVGNINKLKDLITSPKVRFESKGINTITLDNYSNMIFTTNNSNPIPISHTDRRLVCVNCCEDKVGDGEYFSKLGALCKQTEFKRAFYQYLKYHVELPAVDNLQLVRPITDYYKDLQRINTPTWAKFMSVIENHPEESMAIDYYRKYVHWMERCNFKNPLSMTGFGLKMKSFENNGISKGHTRTGSKLIFDWDKIEDYMRKNKLWDDEAF